MTLVDFGVFIMILVCIGKFVLTTLNIIVAVDCVYHGDAIERCNDTLLFNGDSQWWYDVIERYDATMEFISAFLSVIAVFAWKPFGVLNFLKSIWFVGHFWSWGALLVFFVICNLSLPIAHAGTDNSWILVTSTIGEAVFTIIFAGAINFIDREYLQRKFQNKKCVFKLYESIVFLCAYRNLTLFLYDTGLVALSISLISEEQTRSDKKDFTSFVLVMNVALRGSMAQFYFAKFFQGRKLKKVCREGYERFCVNHMHDDIDEKAAISNQHHPHRNATEIQNHENMMPAYLEYALVCELG